MTKVIYCQEHILFLFVVRLFILAQSSHRDRRQVYNGLNDRLCSYRVPSKSMGLEPTMSQTPTFSTGLRVLILGILLLHELENYLPPTSATFLDVEYEDG